MRRAASIFLLILFLFNLCGFYLIYDIREESNRKEMLVSLANESQTAFTEIIVPQALTAGKSHLFERTGEDEICYMGRMYDVASSKCTSDGFVHFYCMNDTREESLKKDFDEQIIVNSAFESAKTAAGKASKPHKCDFISDYLPAGLKISHLLFPDSPSFKAFVANMYQSMFRQIITPPPRFC